ncbi:MAG TPA: hypothetical protein VE690_20565, partial [Rhodopila sp.]|nr:hypothetical protein [Rhodopila sp.]
MDRIFRLAGRVLAVVGIIILLLAGLAAGAVWLTLPSRSEAARIADLSGPADITYDPDWVPRIRASTP